MDIQATAHHEAGHILGAFEAGIEVSKISIVADGDCRGHCIVSAPKLEGSPHCDSGTAWRIQQENLAVVALSGVLAEDAFLGYEADHGYEGDVNKALDYLRRLSGSVSELRAYAESTYNRAEGLVNNPINQALINKLVNALLQYGELDQKAVCSLHQDFIASQFSRRNDADTTTPAVVGT